MSALCGETRLFEKSGNPVQPMYTMPKVLWYKKELPEVYAKTDKILQSNSFIAFRLTGVPTQDPSQGYGWNCYDIKKNEWDTALCRELGVRPGLLPDIAPCQQIIGSRHRAGRRAHRACPRHARGGRRAGCRVRHAGRRRMQPGRNPGAGRTGGRHEHLHRRPACRQAADTRRARRAGAVASAGRHRRGRRGAGLVRKANSAKKSALRPVKTAAALSRSWTRRRKR
jgi:hypothetical protein